MLLIFLKKKKFTNHLQPNHLAKMNNLFPLKTIFLIILLTIITSGCKNYLTESPLILPPQYRDIPQDNMPDPLKSSKEAEAIKKEDVEDYDNIKLLDD